MHVWEVFWRVWKMCIRDRGTLDGLTRYDGNTFLTYQLESGKHDQISLADNRIKHVAEDKNGFLWIKTVPELFSCYDLQKACRCV